MRGAVSELKNVASGRQIKIGPRRPAPQSRDDASAGASPTEFFSMSRLRGASRLLLFKPSVAVACVDRLKRHKASQAKCQCRVALALRRPKAACARIGFQDPGVVFLNLFTVCETEAVWMQTHLNADFQRRGIQRRLAKFQEP